VLTDLQSLLIVNKTSVSLYTLIIVSRMSPLATLSHSHSLSHTHAGPRAPRGGVTQQGVVLTDLQSLLIVNKTSVPLPSLYLSLFLPPHPPTLTLTLSPCTAVTTVESPTDERSLQGSLTLHYREQT
jgi:hypothetical protein